MNIRFFKTASRFRNWLEAHHADAGELWVGFFKKGSGKSGLTYAEAVAEALCFGWIDGIVKRVDAISYTHRFTPRKPRSIWSRINIGHFKRLRKAGLVAPAGLKAYLARDPARSGVYSFENSVRKLSPADTQKFKACTAAWKFFQQQPPGYRRIAIWWVVSAKRDATRTRRLVQLIAESRNGQRRGQFASKK